MNFFIFQKERGLNEEIAASCNRIGKKKEIWTLTTHGNDNGYSQYQNIVKSWIEINGIS
jgi:hypothetical protein